MTKEKKILLNYLLKQYKQSLKEAETPGRAWSGKISKIDKLLAWMYDKNILTQSQKNRKDTIFHQYYRYYNDGDLPGFARKMGLSNRDWDKNRVQVQLEKYLDNFIKQILGKYFSKINRTEFRYDMLLDDLETLKNVAERNDFHGLVKYWGKQVKVGNDEFNSLLSQAQKMHDKLRKEIDGIIVKANAQGSFNNLSYSDKPSTGMSINYTKKQLKKVGLWNKNLENQLIELQYITRKILAIIEDVIQATEKAKSLDLEKQE